MADPFSPQVTELPPEGDDHAWTDPLTARQRQYARAREYCRLTVDDVINSPVARGYLRQVWLLGCMVRKPEKAATLPQGNPFRTLPVRALLPYS